MLGGSLTDESFCSQGFPGVSLWWLYVHWGEGVNLSNLRSEGIIEVDLVIIGSGWQDVVGSFFEED